MKLRILSVAVATLFIASAAMAQPQFNGQPRGGMMMQRTIQITGTSEVDVAPDQVNMVLQLRQYPAQEKDTTLVPMETIENDMYNQLAKLGISKSDIKVCDKPVMPFAERRFERPDFKESRGDAKQAPKEGFQPRDNNNKRTGDMQRSKMDKRPPMRQSKQYEIVLDSYDKVEKVKAAIDSRALASARVTGMSSSKIDESYKQARIEALANATTNATSLVEAAGGELGNVINIVVAPENDRKGKADNRGGKIKVRSAVTVTFGIK